VRRHVTLCGYAWLYIYSHIKYFITCGIVCMCQVAHVLTAAFRERRTVSAVVVWICRTVKKCKKHLKQSSFNGERHICQVNLQIVLFLHVAITCIIHIGTNQIIISQVAIAIATRSLVCVCLQNCEKRRTVRRTALNNIISETSLPVTRYDASFETLNNTRQHAIEDIVRDALQQHGY